MAVIVIWVKRHWFWLAVLAFLWLFFILVPITGDDFTFLAFHDSIHGVTGYISANDYLYTHVNGRVVGNMLGLILVKNTIIAGLVRASMVWLIMFSIVKLVDNKSRFVRNTAVTLTFLVPLAIFKETYAWRAGFFNYVAPVAVIAAVIWCVWLYYRSKTRRRSAAFFGLAAILSVAASLFVENITLGWVVTTLLFVIASAVKYRKFRYLSIATFVGSIVGAAVMFSSPIYRAIAGSSDSYQRISGTSHGMLGMVKSNILPFTQFYITGDELLVIALAVVGIGFLYKKRITLPRWAGKVRETTLRSLLTVFLSALPLYLIVSTYFTSVTLLPSYLYNTYVAFELVAVLLFMLAFVVTILLCVEWLRVRYLAATLVVASLLYTGSLLLVQPFGGRNFYVSYICIIAALLLLGVELFGSAIKKHEPKYLLRISYTVLVVVGVLYGGIFTVLYARQQDNIQLAQQQIQQGKKEIVLHEYPFDSFIHDSHNGIKATRYFSQSTCHYNKCSMGNGITIIYR